MSNPVEMSLTGPSPEEIEKIVQERVEKELAAREAAKKDREKLDIDRLMREEKEKQEEKSRQEAVIREEAKRVAYLDSVRAEEIEDAVIRNTVTTVLASESMKSEEKCKVVESLIMSGKVKSMMAKIESLSEEEKGLLSQYSLGNLKGVAEKGEKLSRADIDKAADALKVLEEGLTEAGERRISQSMANKVDYEKLPPEKKTAYFAANLARETQKKRDEILIKTKERLGVA